MFIIIVYSTETTGAIRRRVEEPPVTGGQVPPRAPVEVDGHDPFHRDDHGPPERDDIDLPNDDVDDSGEQDDNIVTLLYVKSAPVCSCPVHA